MLTRLEVEADQMARRLLLDALNEATAAYWRKRAEDFAALGGPSCDEIAEACRNRARVCEMGGDSAEYAALIREVLADDVDQALR